MSLDYKKSVSKAIFAVGLTAPKGFIEAKVIFIKTINKTWSMSFSSNDIMTKKICHGVKVMCLIHKNLTACH